MARTYNTRSYGSRHYTRRVGLNEQIRDRAMYYGAGVITWPVVGIIWAIYQNTH